MSLSAISCGLALFVSASFSLGAAEASLILHNGKIVTVDSAFSIHEAMAVDGDRIIAVGSDEEILALRGGETRVIDLAEKTVLPGLIDSHVHSTSAAMIEFDHEIPEMNSISAVLDYIRSRAEALDDGEWIHVRQVFITRLREQRYPTRAELDETAPKNPVAFSTGPDASLNTLALELSGIDKNFEVTDGGPGYFERDPETREPTGLLRGLNRFVKVSGSGRNPTSAEERARVAALFLDYNATGLTTVSDRNASPSALRLYQGMRDDGELTVRMMAEHSLGGIGPLEEIQERIRTIGQHPLRKEDPMLRVIGIKMFLDGGMLTGSALMREPWGTSEIYGITDPHYHGVRNIPQDRLSAIVQAVFDAGLQFTAHSVGDGAVHALLEAYEEVNKTTPVSQFRPCITHSNFMSREAIDQAARLGVVLDIQPAWLYLDARTLINQFGYERLRYFQPLRTLFEQGVIAGGGSDHMQKIGSMRSVNPYNPFFGMWITLTRKARWHEGQLHPEETLSREQAIRFYTMNNAYLLFLEDEVGSLEPGKRADFIVLDRDILSCPVDEMKEIQALSTYLDGKKVFERDDR